MGYTCIFSNYRKTFFFWFCFAFVFLCCGGTVTANCYNLREKNVDSQAMSEHQCIQYKEEFTNRFKQFFDSAEIFNEPEKATPYGLIYLSKAMRHTTFKTSQLLQVDKILGGQTIALNLAIAALETQEISIKDYINKVKELNWGLKPNPAHKDIDEYTNYALSVTIELLKQKEGKIGKLAHKILLARGYLTNCLSDINNFELFSSMTNSSISDVKSAISVLQKYGLVLNLLDDHDENRDVVTVTLVHPLLLPVIRYNGRHEKNDILKMILNLPGAETYKYAAMEFADDNLLNEHPEIKTVLIDHPKLINLTNGEKYGDAVILAADIHKILKTPETLYNYGKAMEYSGNETEAIQIFRCLDTHLRYANYSDTSRDEFKKLFSDREIMNISLGFGNIDKRIVKGNLLSLLMKNGTNEEIKEVLTNGSEFSIPYSDNKAQQVLSILGLTKLNYKLADNFEWNFYKRNIGLTIGTKTRKIILHRVNLTTSTEFPSNLNYLELWSPTFFNSRSKIFEFDISDLLTPGTNLSVFRLIHYPLDEREKLKVSLHQLSTVSEVTLKNVIILLKRNAKITPKTIELERISFLPQNTEDKILINDYIDFSQIKYFKSDRETQKLLKMDLGDSVTIDELSLNGIEVPNWENASWTIKQLEMKNMAFFEQTKMKISQLEVDSTVSLNISALPNAIEKISLKNGVRVSNNGRCDLPKLSTLVFGGANASDLAAFSKCPNVVNLKFEFLTGDYIVLVDEHSVVDLKAEDVPKSVKRIQSIYNIQVSGEKVLHLDTLIIDTIPGEDAPKTWFNIPNKLKLNHLVLDEFCSQQDVNGERFRNYLLDIQEKVNILTIGKCNWANDTFANSTISKLVDRNSEYYRFENKRGVAIDSGIFFRSTGLTDPIQSTDNNNEE